MKRLMVPILANCKWTVKVLAAFSGWRGRCGVVSPVSTSRAVTSPSLAGRPRSGVVRTPVRRADGVGRVAATLWHRQPMLTGPHFTAPGHAKEPETLRPVSDDLR